MSVEKLPRSSVATATANVNSPSASKQMLKDRIKKAQFGNSAPQIEGFHTFYLDYSSDPSFQAQRVNYFREVGAEVTEEGNGQIRVRVSNEIKDLVRQVHEEEHNEKMNGLQNVPSNVSDKDLLGRHQDVTVHRFISDEGKTLITPSVHDEIFRNLPSVEDSEKHKQELIDAATHDPFARG